MISPSATILYLEDDEFTRLMVQAQLEQNGFTVRPFAEYRQLRESIGTEHHEIIITDLNVDGQDSNDLLQGLKGMSKAPVVVLTASEKKEPLADLTITKPLTDDAIKNIRNLIAHNHFTVDLRKVYQFACGDDELLKNYIVTFTDNFIIDLSELKNEIEAFDVKAIRNRAHKMLSSVTYYDNNELNTLLRQLENQTGDFTQRQLNAHYGKIEALGRQLVQAVREKTTG